jgi:AraC-like DNA-binding protein
MLMELAARHRQHGAERTDLVPDTIEASRVVSNATSDSFDVVGARFLAGFEQLCKAHGGSAADLFRQAGLTFHEDPRGTTTYGTFIELLAVGAQVYACPDFGMQLARIQSGTDLYGPLGTIMRRSRTLGEALAFVTQHGELHSPAARTARFEIPDTSGVAFSHEIIVGTFARQEQTMEYILLAGHLGAQALTGGRARARQVLLRHRAVSSQTTYRRAFGCEVLFDQLIDGVIFSNDDLANPIVSQDARLHASLIAALKDRRPTPAAPIEVATRNAVLRMMHVGLFSNEHVAAELGLHSRTLHRRLTQAGTSFQQIKTEVRCELAAYYLGHDVSMLWIAGRLGFAEQAVFTRFCQRHLGLPPTALREQLGKVGGRD